MKILLYLIFTIALLVGCSSRQDEPNTHHNNAVFVEKSQPAENPLFLHDTSQSDDTIVLTSNIPTTLNPITNSDADVAQMLNLIFDTLVNIEIDGSISPNLAKYYTINDDSSSVTLVLEDDVFWHDGTEVDADDVVYSIQLLKNCKNSVYYLNSQNISYATVLSPNTVQIFYSTPFSGVLQTLFFPIIPEHIYQNNLNAAPVGSGAYKFVQQTPQKSLSLVRNDNYFKGAPLIEFANVYYAPDHLAMLSAFDRDIVDAVYTEVMNWGKYEKSSNKIYEIATNKYEFIGLNFNSSIIKDLNVRYALNYALNKQALVNIYYLGNGSAASTPINPNSYLYNHYEETMSRDIIPLLLAKAGFTEEQPLRLRMLVNEDNFERKLIAEGIVKMYSDHGIIIIPEFVDANTFTRRIDDGEFELFLGGWKFSYIPDFSFIFHSAADNFINYKDPQMDTLLDLAFRATEENLLDAYNQLQLYIQDQIPYISLFFKSGALITHKRITGVITPTPLNIYKDIELWEIRH